MRVYELKIILRFSFHFVVKLLINFRCCCSVAKSCATLCDPMDCSLLSFSVYGFSQARIVEWVAISPSRISSQPRNQSHVSFIGRWILYHWAIWEAPFCTLLLLLSRFSRVRLCEPIDGSPPGSPVPGILQARTLEWVAIAFSNAWKWKVKVKVKLLSRVQLFETPWTAAYQAPPSMGVSRQEDFTLDSGNSPSA